MELPEHVTTDGGDDDDCSNSQLEYIDLNTINADGYEGTVDDLVGSVCIGTDSKSRDDWSTNPAPSGVPTDACEVYGVTDGKWVGNRYTKVRPSGKTASDDEDYAIPKYYYGCQVEGTVVHDTTKGYGCAFDDGSTTLYVDGKNYADNSRNYLGIVQKQAAETCNIDDTSVTDYISNFNPVRIL